MFGLDLSMQNRVRDFDSGMFFLSFVTAVAMSLPVAIMYPGAVFGKRSFAQGETTPTEENWYRDFSKYIINIVNE